MNDMLEKTLEQVELRKSVSHGTLRLFPLAGGSASTEDGIALLDDAIEEETLRVEELGEDGSVPELRVINSGDMPVLILEGDELIGAKQNRVVNSSVLVAAASELVLPVSCVERGRWSHRSRAFSAGGATSHISLRHLKSRSVHDSLRRGRGHRSDQGAVWREVDRHASAHRSSSPTDALHDTRAALSKKLAKFDALSSEMPAGTRGVVVAIGGHPAALEMLAGPRSFAKVLPKLLAGYALEALEHGENGGSADTSVIEEFLTDVSVASHEEHPSVGEGVDFRIEGQNLSGYALCSDEGMLHAAVFPE